MSNASKIYDVVDATSDQKEMLISFWGLGCLSGNQYSQVVVRRFRLTKAVLDPSSYTKDEKDKIVKVKVIHRGCDYLLCILKHDEIYQDSLNLMFDKGEKVTFYIEGHGKVYLSGYEVNDSVSAIPWDESVTIDLAKDAKTSSPKKSTPIQSSKPKSVAESSKSNRKAKSMKKAPPDEIIFSPKPYLSMLFNGEMNENEDDDDDDDEEEEDEDFCVGEEEGESEDEESEEEELDESTLEEEVQVLEEELKKINDDDEDDDDDDDDDEEDEEEDTKNSEPSVSQKRKRQMLAQPVKRTKKNTSSVDNDVIICEEISETSSDSGAQNSTAGPSLISKSAPTADSAEKKKKKKKKKLNKLPDTNEQMGKSPSSSKRSREGVEIHDLVLGRGPEATYGKLVHIFYVGRLQNKQIFDSRTPGKKPLSFKLGKNTVIRGLEIGLEGMKVGGKRRLIVPPNLGYGNAKIESIPPNSTLEFTVELQAVS